MGLISVLVLAMTWSAGLGGLSALLLLIIGQFGVHHDAYLYEGLSSLGMVCGSVFLFGALFLIYFGLCAFLLQVRERFDARAPTGGTTDATTSLPRIRRPAERVSRRLTSSTLDPEEGNNTDQ